jgi:hypothetical protein
MSAHQTTSPDEAAICDLKSAIDWYKHPLTTEECLLRIQALEVRVSHHVRFMCGVESLPGVSREVKEKAVAGFYERLVELERALSRIGDHVRLA